MCSPSQLWLWPLRGSSTKYNPPTVEESHLAQPRLLVIPNMPSEPRRPQEGQWSGNKFKED